MIPINCEQGSPEWHSIRAGIPTASNFDKIITTKGEPSKQAIKYLYTWAGEKITGASSESYQSDWMVRGIELEDEARSFYEMHVGEDVKKIGFVFKDDRRRMGCSPDGLVGDEGLLELKCPAIHTHVGYLLDGKLPTDYFTQVQGQLFVTGRKWCDFVSYYPGLKPFIIRAVPDNVFITKLETVLNKFCDELDLVVEKIRG